VALDRREDRLMRGRGILFCGGGTGGHVLPGLAVAAALRARGEHDLRWVGDPARIEAKLVPGSGIPLLPVGLSRPRLRDPRWLLASLRQAVAVWRELTERPPRVVVALGGYAALLPGLLAPFTRRPLLVMEQNARTGRTNRLLGRFARVVVTQFAEAQDGLPRHRVAQLGNPVRPIPAAPRGTTPALRVLVVGGSLSAKTLNDLVLAAAFRLARIPHLEIVHCAGVDEADRVRAAWTAAGVRAEVHGFVSDMPALYARIDLAVTRAGATTVAELCCAGIGALYIPLPWAADDHQTANAESVVVAGGARLLPQATVTPAALAELLAGLAADRATVAAMGSAAASLARPRAAADVASLVLATAAGRRGRKAYSRSLTRTAWRDRIAVFHQRGTP
jgi:UDP-N-acetylglucosamine--N-acetylmuramyl-(pentapeptide) pyrophosphoryl-undecaprenol N-acetylglucosamine transferase